MDQRATTMKVFAPSQYADIPFTDLLTWTFGNTTGYDLNKPLFIDTQCHDRTISHNEAKTIVRKLIGGLKANGLKPDDSVCLHSTNNINYALVFLSVIGAGGRFVGSNPHYTVPELVHLFTMSEVKFIIVEEELLKNVRSAAETTHISLDKIFIFNTNLPHKEPEFRSWNVLLNYPESDWIQFDDENLAKNTVATLMSTSGTTGLPKVAQCSHYAHVAQSVMLCEGMKPYKVIRLLALPQFHAFNAPLSLIAPIREGHTTYIMKRYNADEFLNCIRTFKPTETTMVNPIIYKLLDLKENERCAIESLRAIWCGGVPLSVTVQNTFREILHPDAIVKQVWGLTEIGWVTTLKYPENDDTGCAGRLLPSIEARIIDGNGKDVEGDDVRGEIILRSPSMMVGYLKNESATNNTLKEGWLYTGDIGYQRGGKWYIVDRIKELLKVRGWQVSPAEIEKCLLTHPAIIDVAVIGVDFDDARGELPRAYLVLDRLLSLTTSDDDIQKYLIGKLSRYKALDGGVRRVESLPRSSTGKVLKNVLREEAKQEILEAQMKSASLNAVEPPSIETDKGHMGLVVEEKEIVE